ncbi:MAG: hypothetical protein ACOX0F_04945 [Syntrophomonadaceae bacterium]|jgi:hypothetical protein
MSSKEKESKKKSVIENIQDNECPEKDGDNCKVPGVYSDSAPIGGGG